MKTKKILKIVGIILLILIVLLIIHTMRNYVIISNMQNKISEYANSTNYYTKTVTTEEDGTIVTMETYKKDDKQAVFMERNSNGEISKIAMYDNGERIDIFWENEETKTAEIDSETIITTNIYNFLETDNNLETFLGSIFAKIKSTTDNETECYIISNFASSMTLTEEGQKTYVEKDTGLFVKTIVNDIITEKEYEFDNVDDSIFVEPDIGKYTIIEND